MICLSSLSISSRLPEGHSFFSHLSTSQNQRSLPFFILTPSLSLTLILILTCTFLMCGFTTHIIFSLSLNLLDYSLCTYHEGVQEYDLYICHIKVCCLYILFWVSRCKRQTLRSLHSPLISSGLNTIFGSLFLNYSSFNINSRCYNSNKSFSFCRSIILK